MSRAWCFHVTATLPPSRFPPLATFHRFGFSLNGLGLACKHRPGRLRWAAQNSKACSTRNSTSTAATGQKARGGGVPLHPRARVCAGPAALRQLRKQKRQKPSEKVPCLLLDTTPFVGNDEHVSEIIGKKFKSSAIGYVSVLLYCRFKTRFKINIGFYKYSSNYNARPYLSVPSLCSGTPAEEAAAGRNRFVAKPFERGPALRLQTKCFKIFNALQMFQHFKYEGFPSPLCLTSQYN